MLTVRLLHCGLIFASYAEDTGETHHPPMAAKSLGTSTLLFGVFGMLGVQYTFVASINTSNAVIATLFQFLAPIFIIIFVTASQKKWPPIVQVLGMFVTLIGLLLLLTNGSFSGFALSKVAVLWGLALGFAFSFYTLYPVRLMQEWGVLLVDWLGNDYRWNNAFRYESIDSRDSSWTI